MKVVAGVVVLVLVTSCGSSERRFETTTNSMNQNVRPTARFDSPEAAIESLLAAYKARDIEAMVNAKNFAVDSQLFWEDLGLPTTDEQREKSATAFESNFWKQMLEEGVPDYQGVQHSIVGREQLRDDLVIVKLECRWPDGRKAQLKLAAFRMDSQWRTVLAPGYDHL